MYAALALALAAVPTVFAATWQVNVGPGSQLVYDPPFISNAAINDVVIFTFHPKNHTVTQSSFAEPCVAVPGGADSGFQPVATDADAKSLQLIVTQTTPTWFYCRQTGHCGKGMVFAINPPPPGDPHSFANFQALAISINGTATSTTATSTTATTTTSGSSDTYTTPPSQSWDIATATVANGTSTYLTTYTSYVGSPSPTIDPQPIDHKIVVGVDGNLAYGPANISAVIGDTVTFEFHAKNHTVTQSTFSAPCQPLFDTTGKTGFSSGFMPVDPSATTFPTFTITINDTAPIWGYCQQTATKDHCGAGMVFAINAVESGLNNFAAFQTLAERINGTSSTSSGGNTTSPPPGGNGKNAGVMLEVHGAVVLLAAFSVLAYFL